MAKKLKISANIDRLFTELDLVDRIAAAGKAGFSGVDIPLPHDHPAPTLRDKAIFANTPIVRIDAPPPNYTGGPQGFVAQPDCAERFRTDSKRMGRLAGVLGVRLVHLRSGLDAPGDRKTLVDNLRFAAATAPKLTFLIELLNPRDHAAHILATPDSVLSVIDSVGAPNVKVLFSSWHANRQPTGLCKTWELCAPHVGHVLLGGGHAGQADHRAQATIELLKLSGYSGWVCADYTPKSDTRTSLGWLTS